LRKTCGFLGKNIDVDKTKSVVMREGLYELDVSFIKKTFEQLLTFNFPDNGCCPVTCS